MSERMVSTPVSVVLRRSRGVTRWAPVIWRAIGVLPGAAEAPRRVLREDDDGLDLLVATPPLALHRTDADSYRYALSAEPPSLWVVSTLEPREGGADEPVVRRVTASPYEAEAYLESGDEIVDQAPAPAPIVAWIQEFLEKQPATEEFKKRRRGAKSEEAPEGGGLGDPRIRQTSDVYRAPTARGGSGAGGDDE